MGNSLCSFGRRDPRLVGLKIDDALKELLVALRLCEAECEKLYLRFLDTRAEPRRHRLSQSSAAGDSQDEVMREGASLVLTVRVEQVVRLFEPGSGTSEPSFFVRELLYLVKPELAGVTGKLSEHKLTFLEFVDLCGTLCTMSGEAIRRFVFDSYDVGRKGALGVSALPRVRWALLGGAEPSCTTTTAGATGAVRSSVTQQPGDENSRVASESGGAGETGSTSVSCGRILHRLRELIVRNGDVRRDGFSSLAAQMPQLIWPAVRLQMRARKVTLGNTSWTESEHMLDARVRRQPQRSKVRRATTMHQRGTSASGTGRESHVHALGPGGEGDDVANAGQRRTPNLRAGTRTGARVATVEREAEQSAETREAWGDIGNGAVDAGHDEAGDSKAPNRTKPNSRRSTKEQSDDDRRRRRSMSYRHEATRVSDKDGTRREASPELQRQRRILRRGELKTVTSDAPATSGSGEAGRAQREGDAAQSTSSKLHRRSNSEPSGGLNLSSRRSTSLDKLEAPEPTHDPAEQ